DLQSSSFWPVAGHASTLTGKAQPALLVVVVVVLLLFLLLLIIVRVVLGLHHEDPGPHLLAPRRPLLLSPPRLLSSLCLLLCLHFLLCLPHGLTLVLLNLTQELLFLSFGLESGLHLFGTEGGECSDGVGGRS